MQSVAFTPPAPTPRYIPPDAKPSLQGYLRYFRIMSRNPLEIFTERNYEEFFQPAKVLSQPYLLVHDPSAIRRYLVGNASNYGMTRLRKVLLSPLIGDGLLIAEGQLWARVRKSITPVFNHRHVRGFAPVMRDVVRAQAARLARAETDVASMSAEMLTLALDVLVACLFSKDDALDGARFSEDLERILHIAGMPHVLDLVDAPTWLPRLGRGEARRIALDIRGQVSALVKARRARGDTGSEQLDFLSLLMKAGEAEGEPLSDVEIVDNLITFLSAGHETTARTLAWTFYLLTKSPTAEARARAEIDNADLDQLDPADWGEALPFVTAVIKEAMRLYPAAAMLSRITLADDMLGETPVAAGTEIITAPWVLHRHNKLWDRPNEFDPDRFLGDRAKSIDRYSYIPFGAGPRVCIGASFSMQEMVIAVAEFLRAVEISHVGATEPEPVMRITVKPSTPLLMRFKPRGSTSAKS